MGLSPEEVARWVEASCERQGVPVKVEDHAAATQVAKLLKAGKTRVRFAKSA